MKLPLPVICPLPIVSGLRGELLSPSTPNSVCNRKKTSLSGWLPLSPASASLACSLFFFPGPSFPHPPSLNFITQTPSSF
jgi:hypothetical protein